MEHDYYPELLAAFVRGRLGVEETDVEALLAAGRAGGLRMHKFKRTELPRVRKALGILQGLQPESLLDVGSGRGTFLWPLLHGLPELPVTALDVSERRVGDIDAVRRGGIERLRAVQGDLTALPFEDGAFDGVTVLEVLEHLERPVLGLREALRVARSFVLASVPSKPDDNPEHLQFFEAADFEALAREAGASSIRMEHVLNHRVAVMRP